MVYFSANSGLGFSETSRYYALKNINEAQEYLNHPILGSRLIEICTELAKLPINNATQVFGNPDDLKLRSCITLFAMLPHTNPVFQQVLNKYFNGVPDEKTIQLLG